MNGDWRGWTRGQWALRAVVLVAPALALLARGLSRDAPPVWGVALVLVFSAGWALVPESVVGVVVLVMVAWSWIGDSGQVPAAALIAAGCLLAAHLAALVVGYGPGRLPVAPRVVRLWAARGALVFPAAVVAWLLARSVSELPDSSTVWVAGLVVAVSVVLVAVAVLRAVMPVGDEA